jgi:hypothetical protein
MRCELSDYECTATKPMLPNKPRGRAFPESCASEPKEALDYLGKQAQKSIEEAA